MNISRVILLSNTSQRNFFTDHETTINSRFTLNFSATEQENTELFDFIVNAKLRILFDNEANEQEIFFTDFNYGVKFADEDVKAGPEVVVPVWPVIREALLAKCHEYEVGTPPLPFTVDVNSFQKPESSDGQES